MPQYSRSPLLSTLLQALALFLVASAAPAAEIHVDGSTCTMADAIVAASDNGPVGGCPGGDLGEDVIVLDADVILTEAYPGGGSADGAQSGLPDISTPVVIRAGLASRIERDPALGCERGGSDPAFRLLNIRHLTARLEGIELVGGCVLPDDGFAGAGGALWVGSSVTRLDLVDVTVRGAAVLGTGPVTGGGIYVAYADTLTLMDTVVADNRAVTTGTTGGAIASGGGLFVGGAGTFVVEGSDFSGNLASSAASTAAGGGAKIQLTGTDPASIDGTIFEGNVALGDGCAGGGLAYQNGPQAVELSLRTSQFVGNVCRHAPQGASAVNPGGGALHLQGGVIEVEDTLFEGNLSERLAGTSGRAYAGAVHDRSGATYRRCAFVDNVVRAVSTTDAQTEAYGGGIYLASNGASLTNTTLHGNVADGGPATTVSFGAGGAVAAAAGTGILRHASLVGNRAVAGGAGAEGGGLWVAATGAVELSSSVLEDNSVVLADAGIEGAATVQDCWDQDGNGLASDGYNLVSAPGSCTLDAPGDAVISAGLGPLGDWGCTVPLPDGRCVPTLRVGSSSFALEAGSCSASGVVEDARGSSRPVDLVGVSNADDGCDAGAFEAQDPEISGRIFADGFESGDLAAWSSTSP